MSHRREMPDQSVRAADIAERAQGDPGDRVGGAARRADHGMAAARQALAERASR